MLNKLKGIEKLRWFLVLINKGIKNILKRVVWFLSILFLDCWWCCFYLPARVQYKIEQAVPLS